LSTGKGTKENKKIIKLFKDLEKLPAHYGKMEKIIIKDE
jgi:hypothetical protein